MLKITISQKRSPLNAGLPYTATIVALLFVCGLTYAGKSKHPTQRSNQTVETNPCKQFQFAENRLKASQLESLRKFAETLDTDANVTTAANRYAEVMNRESGLRLSARISVETDNKQFTVGAPVSFDVRIAFQPFQRAQFEWKWAVFDRDREKPELGVRSAGGGEAHTAIKSLYEVTGKSQNIGEFELLFMVFGRTLPDGKFDLLDSRRIHYTVRPAMR